MRIPFSLLFYCQIITFGASQTLKIFKMKKLFFLFLVVAVASCGNKKADAIKYNDSIVGEQKKIIALVLDMATAISDGDYDKADAKRLDCIKQVGESKTIIDKMGEFDGSDKLQKAMLSLLTFYGDKMGNEFKQMLELLSGEPDEESLQTIQDLNANVTAEESKLDANLKKMQNEFAAKYDFDIKANEMQKEIDKIK